MTTAFVFPGQGAQYVGMGKELWLNFPIVKDTFAEADDALGFDLSRLILEGPTDQLRLTFYAQPAIIAVSTACRRVFEAECSVRPDVVAGHSVGEYAALVAADVLSFSDAIRLVHERGRLMDSAVPAGSGAMAAILGGDVSKLEALCAQVSRDIGQSVEVANYNCPGQVVISGMARAVGIVIQRAAECGARKALPLDVSGPFHSALMKAAGEQLRDHLDNVQFAAPHCPVVVNITGKPTIIAKELQEALALQVASPVLWETSVLSMLEQGIQTFIEFGPGTVLSGLIRKINRTVRTLHVEDAVTLLEAAG